MRILYVLGGYGEGHLGGSIHTEMAREMRARGHDYHTFAPAHQRDVAGRPAKVLNLSPSTLRSRMQKLGIKRPTNR